MQDKIVHSVTMKKMKPGDLQLTIRIEAKDKAELEAEAAAEGLTLSAYVRRILLGIQVRRKVQVKK